MGEGVDGVGVVDVVDVVSLAGVSVVGVVDVVGAVGIVAVGGILNSCAMKYNSFNKLGARCDVMITAYSEANAAIVLGRRTNLSYLFFSSCAFRRELECCHGSGVLHPGVVPKEEKEEEEESRVPWVFWAAAPLAVRGVVRWSTSYSNNGDTVDLVVSVPLGDCGDCGDCGGCSNCGDGSDCSGGGDGGDGGGGECGVFFRTGVKCCVLTGVMEVVPVVLVVLVVVPLVVGLLLGLLRCFDLCSHI